MRLVTLRAAASLLNLTQRRDFRLQWSEMMMMVVVMVRVCECAVTYGGVEKAFVVHCQIEFGLDALDGHHTKPHRDQVEHSYMCTHKPTQIHTHTYTINTQAHAANKRAPHSEHRGKWGEKSSSISV